MLSVEEREVLRRAYTPQLEQFLERQLQEELSDLPTRPLDKVQIFQGRCLAMQEFIVQLRAAAGITANRSTAKPQL